MTKALDLLEIVYGIIDKRITGADDPLWIAHNLLRTALSEPRTPRWETPEQRLKRTGEAWPEDWAVYAVYEDNDGKKKWFSGCYCRERERMRKGKIPEMIVCATEAGPPPDDWRPEEEEQL